MFLYIKLLQNKDVQSFNHNVSKPNKFYSYSNENICYGSKFTKYFTLAAPFS